MFVCQVFLSFHHDKKLLYLLYAGGNKGHWLPLFPMFHAEQLTNIVCIRCLHSKCVERFGGIGENCIVFFQITKLINLSFTKITFFGWPARNFFTLASCFAISSISSCAWPAGTFKVARSF